MTNQPSPRLMALYGIRNSIDGIRLAVDALILDDERLAGVAPGTGRDPESCPECGAEREEVRDISTIDGTKRRICERCGSRFILERGFAVLDKSG
jgi:hypothetical protein